MNLEKGERDLLSPCASRRYANVRLTKLKARSFGLPLQHVVSFRKIELTKQFLSCQVLGSIREGTHGVVVVYIVVGDKIVYLSQVDKQSKASVWFSLHEYCARVFTEGECGDDTEVVHQCQLYRQVVFLFNRARKTLCIGWLVSFGNYFYS